MMNMIAKVDADLNLIAGADPGFDQGGPRS